MNRTSYFTLIFTCILLKSECQGHIKVNCKKIFLITDLNVFVTYVDGIPQLRGILAERNFDM